MKKLTYILFILTILTSCSKYQKILQSDDISKKYELANELYEAEKYDKARNLFQQVVPQYRGKPQFERIQYFICLTYYKTKKYPEASFQMDRFVDIFPQSEKAAEIAFLSAKSIYELSPVYSKEQKETGDAIAKLQGFINRFPTSEYLEEATKLVQDLDFKLEKKAFEIAKQYNYIARFSDDHVAAIKSFDNFIFNYPGSSFKEDAMYIRFDSAYKLAINSVPWKKEERLNDAVVRYNSFKKAFANSKYIEQATTMLEEINEELKQYNTES